MDISHFIHVLISLSLQFLFLSLFNDPITGAVIGCVFLYPENTPRQNIAG